MPVNTVNLSFFEKNSGLKENSMKNASFEVNPKLLKIAYDAKDLLNKEGLTSFTSEIDSIVSDASRQRFTVAVVGEFSRGKSTFVNRLLGRNILPVANMPTTALLTRIRHTDKKECITIFDASRKEKRILKLEPESWNNYIADDEGNDPNGVAFVGIKSPWLKSGIEIIDTPGAGDLEEKRAMLIGDALKGSDCAIITVSALMAMSLSEKLFIEEHIISKKTPFIMLIITKMDQVEKSQRNGIIDFVKEKLKAWNIGDIPVYVPYDIEMPDSGYDSIIGMDKVVNQINSWISDSSRKKLTEQWFALKLKNLFCSVSDFAKEQKYILDQENEATRKQLLEQKSQALANADSAWDDLKLRMIEKGESCYGQFTDKVSDFKEILIEKMQYEMMRSNALRRWWTEDYPYRLKIEMTNFANSLESTVSRTISNDTAWFNTVLEKNFKTNVICPDIDAFDKSVYVNFDSGYDVEVKDLTKERNITRLGMVALTIGAATACAAAGFTPLIATMGLGTGGPMITESFFKNKTDAQKDILKKELAQRIPVIVNNATSYSEKRIKNIYNDIISEATKKQVAWLESQQQVINASVSADGHKDVSGLNNLINSMNSLNQTISKYA